MADSIPRVGYFGPRLDAHYQVVLWDGITEMADERGCNLVCFPGARINSRENFEYQANILYRLASKANVDGLIILTTAIGILPSTEQIAEFCRSYSPVPVVSVGLLIPGIPSVVIDNDLGMRELVLHLIEHHGFEHFAFISGPLKHQEVELRLSALHNVLKGFGLALDDDMIIPGDFTQESGYSAIDTIVARGKKFDVIVAANDYMAEGALENLKARGIGVPEQVAVVGFDDISSSSFCTPPLTTVFHPMREEGRQALSLLLDVIENKTERMFVNLPCHLVVRESCGCFGLKSNEKGTFVSSAAAGKKTDGGVDFRETVLRKTTVILDLYSFPEKRLIETQWLPKLVDSFIRDIADEESYSFIPHLNRTLSYFLNRGYDVIAWNRIVFVFRENLVVRDFSEESLHRAETICSQAFVLVGEISRRYQGFKRIESERLSRNLWQIGHALITSFDLTRLSDVIVDAVKRIGIRRCFFSLYEKADFPLRSRLVLAYDDGKRIDCGGGIEFPTVELIPNAYRPLVRDLRVTIEPLYFQADQLGFIVFEMTASDTKVYDSLRQQISSALKGAYLVQEITGHTHNLVREVSERTADLTEANRKLREEILERKKIDAALKASEKNFKKITEAAPIPIVLVRMSDGLVLYYNKHFSATFGINVRTKKNLFIKDFFRDPDYINELFERLMRVGSLPDIDLVAKQRKHHLFSVIASFQTISLGGENGVLAGFYDITERKRLEMEILEISGREQRRIGQDLHDDLCQSLAGIAVMLSALEKNLGNIDKGIAARASSISQFINDTIVRTKSLARGLYPAALEESGLAYMLQELSNNIQDQFGIPCFLTIDERTVFGDNSVALNLYRIAQEATNNAVRHGRPTHLEIDYITSDEEVILTIRDDGLGFKKGYEHSKGMGLRIMKYRANMIGAKLDIGEGPSRGVILTCVLKRKN